MDELILEYLRHIRPRVSPKTYCNKQWELKKFYLYCLGKGLSILQIHKENIETYLATIAHCALSTRHDRVMTVRDFYEYLKNKKPGLYPNVNPVEGIRFKNYKKHALPEVPSVAAMKNILSMPGADDEKSLRNRLMAELAYGSGLRRGELEALNIEDLDFEEKRAYITGKGGRTRIVPLTEESLRVARSCLHDRHESRGPLFVSVHGRRMGWVSIGWVFKNKFGINPHRLRHACATHMLKNGCDTRVIQELLGHKYLTTTQVYTHIIPLDVAEIVGKLHPRGSSVGKLGN
jgi:site-specific recombinase XerD